MREGSVRLGGETTVRSCGNCVSWKGGSISAVSRWPCSDCLKTADDDFATHWCPVGVLRVKEERRLPTVPTCANCAYTRSDEGPCNHCPHWAPPGLLPVWDEKIVWTSLDILTLPIQATCLMCRTKFIKHAVFMTADIYCSVCGRKCHTKGMPVGILYVEDERRMRCRD